MRWKMSGAELIPIGSFLHLHLPHGRMVAQSCCEASSSGVVVSHAQINGSCTGESFHLAEDVSNL